MLEFKLVQKLQVLFFVILNKLSPTYEILNLMWK